MCEVGLFNISYFFVGGFMGRIKGLKLWHSPFQPRLGAVEKHRGRKEKNLRDVCTPALFYCAWVFATGVQ